MLLVSKNFPMTRKKSYPLPFANISSFLLKNMRDTKPTFLLLPLFILAIQ